MPVLNAYIWGYVAGMCNPLHSVKNLELARREANNNEQSGPPGCASSSFFEVSEKLVRNFGKTDELTRHLVWV